MSKVKIVSDGSPKGTRVYDEQGNLMQSVTAVRWSIDLTGNAKVSLELLNPEVDLVGEEMISKLSVKYETDFPHDHVHVLFNGERWQIKGGLRSIEELRAVFKLDPGYELHYHSDKWHKDSWMKVEHEVFVSCASQFVSQAPSGGSA